MSERRRVSVALVLAGTFIALVVGAGGCAGARTASSASPNPKPQWNVGALRAGLPGVLVLRGRSLAIAKLDGTTETTVWTAPAETTPTILDVARSGGRIAVLLEAARVPTVAPIAWGYPDDTMDAGIVILSADGSVRRFPVQARSKRVRATVGFLDGPTRSIDTSEVDRVNSAAFAGDDLLIATSGPRLHYPSPGTPLLMAPDGTVTELSTPGTRTIGVVSEFVGLARGGAVAIRGPMFMGGGDHFAALVDVRGNTLTTATPAYADSVESLGEVGSTDDSASIAYTGTIGVAGGTRTLRRTIIATQVNGVWTTRTVASIPWPRNAKGEITHFPKGAWDVAGAPGAGPDGDLLLPVMQVIPAGDEYEPWPEARLMRVGSSDKIANRLTGIRIQTWGDHGTRSWEWLDRFGR